MLNTIRDKEYIQDSQIEYLLPKEYQLKKSYFMKAVKIDEIKKKLDYYLSWLSKREYCEYVTYRNQKRRCEWLSARVAAKILLKENTFFENIKQGEILKNKLGAPFIVNNKDLFISISHSHNMAIVTLAYQPIGIDIEYIEPRPQSLCQLFFCTDELDYISRLKGYNKTLAINRIWTYKEAVSKVLGLGGKMDFIRINSMYKNFIDPYTHLIINSQSFTFYNYIITIANGTKQTEENNNG